MTALNKAAEVPPVGRERFLQRIARLRRHEAKVKEKMSEAILFARVFEKIGISTEDLEDVRAKSTAYTRVVGRSFVESLARKNLSAMAQFSKCAHLTNAVDYRQKGRSIPMQAVASHSWQGTDSPPPPPPSAESVWLPPDTVFKDCHLHGEGIGDGVDWPWVSDDGTRGGSCDIVFNFQFVPDDTGIFTFTSSVMVGGLYYLVANDGPFDSKEASCSFGACLGVTQSLGKQVVIAPGITADKVEAYTPEVVLFSEDSQNICYGDVCFGWPILNTSLLLFAKLQADISVTVSANAWARGGGSLADLNLARPTGSIGCPGLSVS